MSDPHRPDLAPLLAPTAELYLDLHRHPELSGAESRTAGRFADWLEKDGFRVVRGVGGHGVAAELRNGEGPVILLRAELDALPLAERTGAPYASEVTAPGPDGSPVPVMHACGHDAHLACAAAAARWFAGHRDTWRGTLLMVGQPAEETLTGARAMLEDGLYERITVPDIVLAQHTAAFPAGMVAHAEGPLMAGSRTLSLVFEGPGGHAATPHLTADPLAAAAAVITRLPAMTTRESSPAEGLTITATSLHTDGTPHTNMIAMRAELRVTIRAFTPPALSAAVAAVTRAARAETTTPATPPTLTITELSRSEATLPDRAVTTAIRETHRKTFTPPRVTAWPPSPATEDFPLLTGAGAHLHGHGNIRGGYWMLGTVGPAQWSAAPGRTPSEKFRTLPHNHSPHYLPSVRLTLETGTTALITAALTYLTP